MTYLVTPSEEIINELDHLINKHHLHQYKKEIYYHFNLGEWHVNLADTKRAMINYDFRDLVSNFYAKCERNDGETVRDFQKREKEETERLRSALIKLYQDFKQEITETLTPIVKKMDYNALFELFEDTWGNAPFKLNYLLEDMFLLLGDKSVMQNVVGNSGSFKSTRSIIEFNSLPSVLLIDDATVAGISRDCQSKGIEYLDNTVVYYNDVGDSAQMQANFKDCLQSVYKKLFSEGAVNRTLAMKNSDKTLRLNLRTPHGLKLKFNSVKPIFNDDDGQTKARTMIISLPSITPEEAEEMVYNGTFGKDVWTKQDPRIFKDVFKIYYDTREFDGFDGEFGRELAKRCNKDNNNEANMHLIGGSIYRHEEMCKLYGEQLYKEKYFNRVMIKTSMLDMENQLYDIIAETLLDDKVGLWFPNEIPSKPDINVFTVAHIKSASAHKEKYEYDAFTIKAVKGIRRKFIKNNEAKISSILKSMEEHGLCRKVGTLENYNIYVLLKE